MIAEVNIHSKSFGAKDLYSNLELRISAGEKIGLIGRNGSGKSTLLNILSGIDNEYDGEARLTKGTTMVSTRQEHHKFEDTTVLDYIAHDLPEFSKLSHIIQSYPAKMHTSKQMLQRYSDALERFSQLGYYDIEHEITQAFEKYQIEPSRLTDTVGSLSGGQKRLVELVKVQRSRADLALIDEPTNHMDYVAKNFFIEWLASTDEAVLVITHDRDVLNSVDRIVEIRDGKADVFRGGYDKYLKINASSISAELNEYEVTQRRIKNLHSDISRFKRLKERARDPDTIKQFKLRQNKAAKKLSELQEKEKPSFWIDQESTANLSTKITAAYDQHKARNIKVQTKTKVTKSRQKLIGVSKLALGYDNSPLFTDVSFELREGDRLQLHGRNGVGKTTLVKSIIAASQHAPPPVTVFEGTIDLDHTVTIGVYEQELQLESMDLTLEEAIYDIHARHDLDCNQQRVRQLMNDYLFKYETDARLAVSDLSGGQRSRLQLIDMLTGQPNVLILDEPTNHLDLPSIEELESAMNQYHGAVIYISHDSYFAEKIGGEVVTLP